MKHRLSRRNLSDSLEELKALSNEMSSDPDFKEALNKSAANKNFDKYDASKNSDELHQAALDWTEWGDPEAREKLATLPRHDQENEMFRAKNKLSARTKTRKNPETGEREFLLHRGTHTPNDLSPSSHTSWTPHYEHAAKFARDYGNDPKNISKNIISAWIPESKIALIPNQLHPDTDYSHEYEVIVKPHNINSLKKSDTKISVNPPSQDDKKLQEHESYSPDYSTPGHVIRTSPDGNHMIHEAPGRAKILLGKDNNTGKWHERAASGQKDHLEDLRNLAKEKTPGYSGPVVIGPEHLDEKWADHHPELALGIVPDKNLGPSPNTITSWLSFAGKQGDQRPSVLAKEALSKELDKVFGDHVNDIGESYLRNPNFTTAHREALYSKLAKDLFGLEDYVPKTTIFQHPLSKKPWSAQALVENPHPTPDLSHLRDSGVLHKLSILDAFLGNHDRHEGNLLGSHDENGNVKPNLIDNGLAFDYNRVVKTKKYPFLVDKYLFMSPVPEHVENWIKNINFMPDSAATKAINEAARKGVPHDIIEALYTRLGDTKGFLHSIERERRRTGKKIPLNIKDLLDYISTVEFRNNVNDRYGLQENIKPRVLDEKNTLTQESNIDRTMPMGAEDPTQVSGTPTELVDKK